MTTKAKRRLSWHLVIDEEGVPFLRITEETGIRSVRSKTDWYRIEVNRNARNAFRLHKMVHSDEEPRVYDVRLSGPHPSCDCIGQEAHGTGCKHLAALRGLLEDGELEVLS